MCRNIRTLFNFDPPATDDEIRASSLQFVRKLSGFNKPSKANEAAFDAAVEEGRGGGGCGGGGGDGRGAQADGLAHDNLAATRSRGVRRESARARNGEVRTALP